jgi:tetratricopeptide (TPR) repeat protein
MGNTYFTWDKFVENFGREMRIAGEIFDSMAGNGLREGCLCCFDFTFVANRRENLERLAQFLKLHYFYSITGIKLEGSEWILDGKTGEIPVTADNLMYWALDMYKRGYEFDAEFDAYGAPFNPAEQAFHATDSAQEQSLFDRGVKQYEQGNLSGALMTWSEVIALNPKNANAYYSRAVVKNELHTWKSALRDYDAALEIAPTFGSALLNRGSVRDDNGDYVGAIEDYDKVIGISDDDEVTKTRAYFNRGNTKLHLKDKNGACADWNIALGRGDQDAQRMIDKYCKKAGILSFLQRR